MFLEMHLTPEMQAEADAWAAEWVPRAVAEGRLPAEFYGTTDAPVASPDSVTLPPNLPTAFLPASTSAPVPSAAPGVIGTIQAQQETQREADRILAEIAAIGAGVALANAEEPPTLSTLPACTAPPAHRIVQEGRRISRVPVPQASTPVPAPVNGIERLPNGSVRRTRPAPPVHDNAPRQPLTVAQIYAMRWQQAKGR